MKANLTISRVHANDDGDDYMVIRVKIAEGKRITMTLSLEDFALAITGQEVDAKFLQIDRLRGTKCHTS